MPRGVATTDGRWKPLHPRAGEIGGAKPQEERVDGNDTTGTQSA